MSLDESTSPHRPTTASDRGRTGPSLIDGRRLGVAPAPPPVGRSLTDEADGLIRALVACAFTVAGIQSHHRIDTELTEVLTDLITDLDDGIRQIRRALCVRRSRLRSHHRSRLTRLPPGPGTGPGPAALTVRRGPRRRGRPSSPR